MVVEWYNLCRDVLFNSFSKCHKMDGHGCILEIDESFFFHRDKNTTTVVCYVLIKEPEMKKLKSNK